MSISKGKKTGSSLLRKVCAWITLVVFCAAETAWSVPQSYPYAGPASAKGRQTAPVKALQLLPEEFGRIKKLESNPASRADIFVIHVQDAHANAQAQQSIYEMLNFLSGELKEYRFTVGVEGTSGELHPEFFDFFPDYPKAGESVIRDMLNRGELSGAELFAWKQYAGKQQSRRARFMGIEDTDLYADNLRLFQELLASRNEIERQLAKIKAGLLTRESHLLNARLRDFFRERDRRKQGVFGPEASKGQTDLGAYVHYLASTALRTLSIDLKDAIEQLRFPNLVRVLALQTEPFEINHAEEIRKSWQSLLGALSGKVSGNEIEQLAALRRLGEENGYLRAESETALGMAREHPRQILEKTFGLFDRYGIEEKEYRPFLSSLRSLILGAEIDAGELFREIEILENATIEKLAVTAEEKAWVRKREIFSLGEKLLFTELTTDDYNGIKKAAEELPALLREFGKDYLAADDDILSLYGKAVSFYEGALKRDRALTRWVKRSAEAPENEKASARPEKEIYVLLAGGFHSRGIEEELAAMGVSYAVVQPHISSTDGGDLYRRVMAGFNADLTPYFGVPNPFSTRQEAVLFRQLVETALPVLFEEYGLSAEQVSERIQKVFLTHPVLKDLLEMRPITEGENVSINFLPSDRFPAGVQKAAIAAPSNAAAPDINRAIAVRVRADKSSSTSQPYRLRLREGPKKKLSGIPRTQIVNAVIEEEYEGPYAGEGRSELRAFASEEDKALFRSTFQFLGRPQVTGAPYGAEVSASFKADPGILGKLELFVHWGDYNDPAWQWTDEEILPGEIEEAGAGQYRFKASVTPEKSGEYGVTVYAKLKDSGEILWLGKGRKDDVVMSVDVSAREMEDKRLDAEREAKEKEYLRQIRASLSEDNFYEAFVSAIARLTGEEKVRGIGRYVYEATRDSRFLSLRVSRIHKKLKQELAQPALADETRKRILPAFLSLETLGVGEVVFVAPEGPHAIAGGLAKVIEELSRALGRHGISVTVITNLYMESQGKKHKDAAALLKEGLLDGEESIKLSPAPADEIKIHYGPMYDSGTQTEGLSESKIRRFARNMTAKVHEGYSSDGVRYLFLSHPRLTDKLYANVPSSEMIERAILLSRGALELMTDRRIGIKPHIAVGHDWLAGLLPLYMEAVPSYKEDPLLKDLNLVHMIHNYGRDYQGRIFTNQYGTDLWPLLGLEHSYYNMIADPNNGEFMNITASVLKAAEAYQSIKAVLTVSPNYARGMLTPESGEQLHELLGKVQDLLFGISNGIELELVRKKLWKAAEEARKTLGLAPLLETYDSEGFVQNLPEYKRNVLISVQKAFGLEENPQADILSNVGRLASQKGIELFTQYIEGRTTLEAILQSDPNIQIIIGGPVAPGDPTAEELQRVIEELVARPEYAKRIAGKFEFIDPSMAVTIMMASLFFIMPSFYEPGGITQLESEAAGTFPVARNVGGIAATIVNYLTDPENGTGFLFDEFSGEALLAAIRSALDVFGDPALSRDAMIRRAANETEIDWSHRIPHFLALFQQTAGIISPVSYAHLLEHTALLDDISVNADLRSELRVEGLPLSAESEERAAENIAAMYSAVESGEGPDIVIVVSAQESERRYWKERLESVRGQVIGPETVVFSVLEDYGVGKPPGNGLGSLLAYQNAKLQSVEQNGKDWEAITGRIRKEKGREPVIAMYHTAGYGSRVWPITGAEGGSKSRITMPRMLKIKNANSPMTLLESTIFQTSIFAKNRPDRMMVFWGDQIFIPTAELEEIQSPAKSPVEILALAGNFDLNDIINNYGLIALKQDEAGSYVASRLMQKPKTVKQASDFLASYGSKELMGKSLGSFTVDMGFWDALAASYETELNETDPAVQGRNRADTDADWWIPLTQLDHFFRSGGVVPSGAAEARSLLDAAQIGSDQISDRVLQLYLDYRSREAEPVMNVINAGEDALWWDFGNIGKSDKSTKGIFRRNILVLLDSSAESRLARMFWGLPHPFTGRIGSIEVEDSIILDSRFEEGSTGTIRGSVIWKANGKFDAKVSGSVLYDVIDARSDTAAPMKLLADNAIGYRLALAEDTEIPYQNIWAGVSVLGEDILLKTTEESDPKVIWAKAMFENPLAFGSAADLLRIAAADRSARLAGVNVSDLSYRGFFELRGAQHAVIEGVDDAGNPVVAILHMTASDQLTENDLKAEILSSGLEGVEITGTLHDDAKEILLLTYGLRSELRTIDRDSLADETRQALGRTTDELSLKQAFAEIIYKKLSPEETAAAETLFAAIRAEKQPFEFTEYFDFLTASRLQAAGAANFRDYLQTAVGSNLDELELYARYLLNAFSSISTYTRQSTAFFRMGSREAFMRYLDELIVEKMAAGDKTLGVKSVGVSSGEEPYTLGMMIYYALKARYEAAKDTISALEKIDAFEAWAQSWNVSIEGYDNEFVNLVLTQNGLFDFQYSDPVSLSDEDYYADEPWLYAKTTTGRPGPGETWTTYDAARDSTSFPFRLPLLDNIRPGQVLNFRYEAIPLIKKWMKPMYADIRGPEDARILSQTKVNIILATFLRGSHSLDDRDDYLRAELDGSLDTRYSSLTFYGNIQIEPAEGERSELRAGAETPQEAPGPEQILAALRYLDMARREDIKILHHIKLELLDLLEAGTELIITPKEEGPYGMTEQVIVTDEELLLMNDRQVKQILTTLFVPSPSEAGGYQYPSIVKSMTEQLQKSHFLSFETKPIRMRLINGRDVKRQLRDAVRFLSSPQRTRRSSGRAILYGLALNGYSDLIKSAFKSARDLDRLTRESLLDDFAETDLKMGRDFTPIMAPGEASVQLDVKFVRALEQLDLFKRENTKILQSIRTFFRRESLEDIEDVVLRIPSQDTEPSRSTFRTFRRTLLEEKDDESLWSLVMDMFSYKMEDEQPVFLNHETVRSIREKMTEGTGAYLSQQDEKLSLTAAYDNAVMKEPARNALEEYFAWSGDNERAWRTIRRAAEAGYSDFLYETIKALDPVPAIGRDLTAKIEAIDHRSGRPQRFRSELRSSSTNLQDIIDTKHESVKEIAKKAVDLSNGEEAYFNDFVERMKYLFIDRYLSPDVTAEEIAADIQLSYSLFMEYITESSTAVKVKSYLDTKKAMSRFIIVSGNMPGVLAEISAVMSRSGGDIRKTYSGMTRSPLTGREVSIEIVDVRKNQREPLREGVRESAAAAIRTALEKKMAEQEKEQRVPASTKIQDALIQGPVAILREPAGGLDDVAFDIFAALHQTGEIDDTAKTSAIVAEDLRRFQEAMTRISQNIAALPETFGGGLPGDDAKIALMQDYIARQSAETVQLAMKSLAKGTVHRQNALSMFLTLIRDQLDDAQTYGREIRGLTVTEVSAIAKAVVNEVRGDISPIDPSSSSEEAQRADVDAQIRLLREAVQESTSAALVGDPAVAERLAGLNAFINEVIVPQIVERIEGHVSGEPKTDPYAGIQLLALRAIPLVVMPIIAEWEGKKSVKLEENAKDLKRLFKDVIRRITKVGSAGEFVNAAATDRPLVLFAHELDPYRLMRIVAQYPIAAIVTDGASAASHWVLVAENRSPPIPVFIINSETSPIDVSSEFWIGKEVILDGRGLEGSPLLLLNPTSDTQENYIPRVQEREAQARIARRRASEKAITRDGKEVGFFANADHADEIAAASGEYGAEGIGLVRTEYLFTKKNAHLVRYLNDPTESNREELLHYMRDIFLDMAIQARDKPVTLRMLDMQRDKLDPDFELLNPGDKKFGADYYRTPTGQALLEIELEAALLANMMSAAANIRVLFPMFRSPVELKETLGRSSLANLEPSEQARLNEQASQDHDLVIGVFERVKSKMLDDEAFLAMLAREMKISSSGLEPEASAVAASVRDMKTKAGGTQRGIMIETVEALEVIHQLLEKVDFISVGTNDLVISLFRDQDISRERNPEFFDRLQPLLLDAIRNRIMSPAADKNIRLAAEGVKKKISVTICGATACSPDYVLAFADTSNENVRVQLSGSAGLIPALKEMVRYMDAADREFVNQKIESEEFNAKARESLRRIAERQVKEDPDFPAELEKVKQGELEIPISVPEGTEEYSEEEDIRRMRSEAVGKKRSGEKIMLVTYSSTRQYRLGAQGLYVNPIMMTNVVLRQHSEVMASLYIEGSDRRINLRDASEVLGAYLKPFSIIRIEFNGKKEDVEEAFNHLDVLMDPDSPSVPIYNRYFASRNYIFSAGSLEPETLDKISALLRKNSSKSGFSAYATDGTVIVDLLDTTSLRLSDLAGPADKQIEIHIFGPSAGAVLREMEEIKNADNSPAILPQGPLSENIRTELSRDYMLGWLGLHMWPAMHLAEILRDHPDVTAILNVEGRPPLDIRKAGMSLSMMGIMSFQRVTITVNGIPSDVDSVLQAIEETVEQEHGREPVFNSEYAARDYTLGHVPAAPEEIAAMRTVLDQYPSSPEVNIYLSADGRVLNLRDLVNAGRFDLKKGAPVELRATGRNSVKLLQALEAVANDAGDSFFVPVAGSEFIFSSPAADEEAQASPAPEAVPAVKRVTNEYMLGWLGMHMWPVQALIEIIKNYPELKVTLKTDTKEEIDVRAAGMRLSMEAILPFERISLTVEGKSSEVDEVLRQIDAVVEQEYSQEPVFSREFAGQNYNLSHAPLTDTDLTAIKKALEPFPAAPQLGVFISSAGSVNDLRAILEGKKMFAFKPSDVLELRVTGPQAAAALAALEEVKDETDAPLFVPAAGYEKILSSPERREEKRSELRFLPEEIVSSSRFKSDLISRNSDSFIFDDSLAPYLPAVRQAAQALDFIYSAESITSYGEGISLVAAQEWVRQELVRIIMEAEASYVSDAGLKGLVSQLVPEREAAPVSALAGEQGPAVHVGLEKAPQDITSFLPILAVIATYGGSLHLNIRGEKAAALQDLESAILAAAREKGIKLRQGQFTIAAAGGSPFVSVPNNRLASGEDHGLLGALDSVQNYPRRKGIHLFQMEADAVARAEVLAAYIITVIRALALDKQVDEYAGILDPRKMAPDTFGNIVQMITTYLEAQAKISASA